MSDFQRLIKYGAIAFAVFLCFTIISSIIFAVMTVSGIFIGMEQIGENSNIVSETQIYQEKSNIEKLEIKLKVYSLEIKQGDALKVETQNASKDFEAKVTGNTLYIEENEYNVFWNRIGGIQAKVILTLPKNTMLEEAMINLGVGKCDMQDMVAKKLELNCGVGVAQIQNLITQDTKIKGGAGKVSITESNLGNLKFEAGIGKTDLEARINGDSQINCGVGKTNITIYGKKSDYKTMIKKGLGKTTIDDEEVEDNMSYGQGENKISITSGVGKVTVNFQETDRI